MKLETTLPERPGFLHAVPIFDLFGLLLVIFLLGPSFLRQAGVQVELPVSRFQVERRAGASVITLSAGNPPVIHLERREVALEELGGLLEKRREDSPGEPTVYVRTDGDVPAGFERQVAEAAALSGFAVYLLGQPEASGEER